MNKRDFLKTGFVGALGLFSLPSFASKKSGLFQTSKEFKLPELAYAYDALEPYIDKETMIIHYTKHYAGYIAKLNAALAEQGIVVDTALELIQNASKYNQAIVNNAGGYINHKIFWNMMSRDGGGEPSGELAIAINSNFGSFEKFKAQFGTAAKSLFGSGWAWLVYRDAKLKIVTTPNQNNPQMDTIADENKGQPLLCIDVWEHAYYLKYQNRRADYVDAFWNIVNWDTVGKKYQKAKLS